MKGNFHAPFWTGGGEGDLLADHTGLSLQAGRYG